MSTKPLKQPLPGEHIIQVEPRPAPFVEAGWLSRPNIYTGRALSAEVLKAEQRGRAGRLALSGQRVSPGVVEGLEVRLERAMEMGKEVWYFHVSPGRGLAASGEDVVVPRLMRMRTSQVFAWKPEATLFNLDALLRPDSPGMPRKPQATQTGLSVAVLVLVPVVIHREEEVPTSDPSEVDPDAEAFEDPHLVDGVVPVLCAWPQNWPLPQKDDRRRNKLAHMIFDYERQRSPEALAPWEELGMPVALVGFEPAHLVDGAPMPLFVDRASVVRHGGAPRKRTALLPLSGTPLLWQARIQQFAEHLADLGAQVVAEGKAMQSFSRLPPVGLLPPRAVDFRHWTQRFFPSRFITEAMPVPLEQLDAVVQASAALAPLRAAKPERVRLLVPVPQEHFEPRLLQSEFLSVAFPRAVSKGLWQLGEWRRRQQNLRGKFTVLVDALEGRASSPRFPTPDPAAIPAEHVGVTPASEAIYGPEEAAYGTQGERIPELDEVLQRWSFDGTWSPPRKLDERRFGTLSATSDPETSRIFMLNEPPEDVSSLLRYEAGAWQPPEKVSHGKSPTVIRSGRDFLLFSFKLTTRPGTELRDFHILVSRWTPYGMKEISSAPLLQSIESDSIKISPVPRGDGTVDVFAVIVPLASTGNALELWRWTWREGFVGEPQRIFTATKGVCLDLAAVRRAPGQVDVFLLKHVEYVYSVPHLAGTLSADGSYTFAEPSIAMPDTKALTYYDHYDRLQVCSPSPNRLDVFLQKTQQIIHYWSELSHKTSGSWSREVAYSGQGDAYSLLRSMQALSPRLGRIDLVWVYWNHAIRQIRILHLRFDGSWHPERLLTDKGGPTSSHTPGNLSVVPGVLGLLEVLWVGGEEGTSHITKLADDSLSLVINRGLQGLIAHDTQSRRRLDDLIQSNRLRVQSDVQRVRQIMISGTTEEGRLTASPVLSRAVSSSQFDLQEYLERRREEGDDPIQSDALEAMQGAAMTKCNVLEQLVLMVREAEMNVMGLWVPGLAQVITESGLQRVKLAENSAGAPTKQVLRENMLLSDLVNLPLSDLTLSPKYLGRVLERIEKEPEALARALDVAGLAYSSFDYFTTAVQLLEHTLSLLRGMELMLEAHFQRTNAFQATLHHLETYRAELDRRLRVVDGKVGESRQNVTVARALMAEEQARVDTVNERRQKVLKEHVRMLVFQRPREKGLDLNAPVRVLDSARVQDVLSEEALASTAAAPPELWAFIELLKDMPLRWLTMGPSLLDKLDRLELLQGALERARERVGLRTPPSLSPRLASPSPQAGQGLSQLLFVQQELVARHRNHLAATDPATLRQRSWRELQRQALELLTPGDLMDVGYGRSDVGHKAAAELERLARVATSLYQRFGQLSPMLRLGWVEDFSQYDAVVDLHDLARLPRWDQVESPERREMQRLVDWLFGQVSPHEPNAVLLVNDLVRACLLLASHAPVDELVGAHVSRPAVARVGELVELTLDPARVRIGMHVLMSTGGHTVQAVVEDLSSGTAQARVFSATAPIVHLSEKTAATLSDPGRGKGALLPGLGTKR